MSKHNTLSLGYLPIKNIDILDSAINRTSNNNVIMPHVCDNINKFNSVFAKYLSSKYPYVKENFHLLGKNAKLGYTQFVTIHNNKSTNNKVIVANMVAHNGLPNSSSERPLNYFFLCHCMNIINLKILDMFNNDNSSKVEIHAPRFGTGLSKGNWKFIEELIKDIWASHSVFIYER